MSSTSESEEEWQVESDLSEELESDLSSSTDIEVYLQSDYYEKWRSRPYNLDEVINELKLKQKGYEIDSNILIYIHDELCPSIRKYHERKNRHWVRKLYNFYFGENKPI